VHCVFDTIFSKQNNLSGENMRPSLYHSKVRMYVARKFYLCTLLTTILFLQTLSFADNNGGDSITYNKTAPVIIDGYTLFSVRGMSSYPAEERANVIRDRIENIAKDYSIPANSIKIVRSETSDDLYAQNKIIVKIYDFDSRLEGVRREVLAMGLKKRVTESIYSYRYERKSETLLTKTFYAIGATLIMIMLLLIISWIMKKINSILESKLKIKLDTLETRSFQLIKSNQLWVTLYGIIKGLKFLVVLIIIFLYAQYVLGLYPWTRFVSVSLIGVFLTPFSALGMALLNFIPHQQKN
jgi:hypothetical protein